MANTCAICGATINVFQAQKLVTETISAAKPAERKR